MQIIPFPPSLHAGQIFKQPDEREASRVTDDRFLNDYFFVTRCLT